MMGSRAGLFRLDTLGSCLKVTLSSRLEEGQALPGPGVRPRPRAVSVGAPLYSMSQAREAPRVLGKRTRQEAELVF